MLLKIAHTPVIVETLPTEAAEGRARHEAVNRELVAARRMLRGVERGQSTSDVAFATAVERLIDHAARECGMAGRRDESRPLRGLIEGMRPAGDDGHVGPDSGRFSRD
jgi:hypothetical protein